jgi:hypothetical protein
MEKHKYLIIILAVVFISFVLYNQFSLPLDVITFNPDILYRSNIQSSTIDPKEYYNKLNNILYNENDELCNYTLSYGNNLITIEDNRGIVYPSNEIIEESLYKDNIYDFFYNKIGINGEELFKDNDLIIMPLDNMGFKNNNKLNSSLKNEYDKNDIEIVIGTQYLLVFEDVKSWWCHNHVDSENIQHDIFVGNSSKSTIKQVGKGAIIGKAKSSTLMKIYKIKSNITDIRDATSIDKDLELINTNDYLFNKN